MQLSVIASAYLCARVCVCELCIECPAEFRVTEFRRNFMDFFSGIPPELSYGIPYILPNSVHIYVCAEFRFLRNSEFR